MSVITLLVDSLDFKEKRISTPGEKYDMDREGPDFGSGWLRPHNQLIWHLVKTKEFNIIPISEFNNKIHENPHYLINGTGDRRSLRPSLNYIPVSSADILKKYKIPILIFFALEFIMVPAAKWLLEYRNLFDEKGFSEAKIKILSIDSIFDKNFKKLDYCDLSSELKNINIKHVDSIAFLSYWDCGEPRSKYKHLDLNNDCVSLEEHECVKKSKLFLNLNNRDRPNRRLLLLAVYINKSEIKDYIVSQRFSMTSEMIIQTLYDFVSQIHRSDPLNKSDFVKNIICPTSKNIVDQNTIKKYLDFIKDPAKKLQLELWISAKDFKIPEETLLVEKTPYEVNTTWNKSWYTDSWCSIITETFSNNLYKERLVSGIQSPMISEKTLKPILNYHPFIVFGSTYSNKLLRQYGFKTFDKTWFELPEEGTPGNQTVFERLYNLIESLKRLSNYSDEQMARKWDMIKDDLIYNKQHLLNNNWARIQKNLILGCEEENTNL